MSSAAAVHVRPEELIRHLLEGTSSQTGHEFLKALVRSVALAMDVSGVWVTEYLPERRMLRALAFWMNGDFIQDFEYYIDGTPCELVVEEQRLVHIPERVIDLFPDDPDLVKLNAVSYAGVPLMRSDGTVMGHLSALDTKPLELFAELESAFRIFAARATAELNRLRAESAIRESEQRFSGLFDSAMDAIFELDDDFVIQRANGRAATLFGRSSESLSNSKLSQLFAPPARKNCARWPTDWIARASRLRGWPEDSTRCAAMAPNSPPRRAFRDSTCAAYGASA